MEKITFFKKLRLLTTRWQKQEKYFCGIGLLLKSDSNHYCSWFEMPWHTLKRSGFGITLKAFELNCFEIKKTEIEIVQSMTVQSGPCCFVWHRYRHLCHRCHLPMIIEGFGLVWYVWISNALELLYIGKSTSTENGSHQSVFQIWKLF